jgi:two-component system, NtrC family, response regulator HydG
MRIDDLDLRELLDVDPKGGIVRFANERALILDTVALGLLRRELIDTLGLDVARGVLTRFGFSHGWRTAETLRDALPWESEREWRIAGGRLHQLQGMTLIDPLVPSEDDTNPPFAESIWHQSYEAEQHLLHVGRADEPVCWTLTGFVSGYLTFANATPIYALETRCMGQGQSCCHMVARKEEAWGEQIRPHVPYYQRESLDDALTRITEALKSAESRLLVTRRRETSDAAREPLPEGLVARSHAMAQAIEVARRVARVDATTLIEGESGVGKERIARFIHNESARAAGPFLGVNCGAIAESLLESELFGHKRGSFTGASEDRVGLFEAANGGTLFLDEVAELPRATQVKLLRVLQEREVRRVGESRNRPINARIIAATNRKLSEAVRVGEFREDLYYRLGVVELRVPPLRERPDDVLPLARLFLEQASREFGLPVPALSPKAMGRLLSYPWPGNVRELRNAIERAVILTSGERIGCGSLPLELREARAAPRMAEAVRPLADVEREVILAAVELHGGNREKAAEALGIGVATLYRRLKQYRSG